MIRQRLDEVLAAGDPCIKIEKANPEIGEARGPAPVTAHVLSDGTFYDFGPRLGLPTFDPGEWHESPFFLSNQLKHFVDAFVI